MTHLANLEIGLADAMMKLEWSSRTSLVAALKRPSLELMAARNEVIGFQVLLQAPEPFVLALDDTNWIAPLGFIPRIRLQISFPELDEALETFVVGYLEDDDRRWRTEYLDRSRHVEVVPGRPQAAYIRLRVPTDAKPGNHQGTVRAYVSNGFEDETLAWVGSVRLHVADVTLPNPADWPFHLDLWQHFTSLASAHGVPLWSDAHFAVLERYLASLSALGQKAITVIATEMPWSGQFCFQDAYYPSYVYEHAIIEVRRDQDGVLHLGLNNLERLLSLAAKYGLDREIEVFGLLNIWVNEEYGFGKVVHDAPDSVRVRCFDEVEGRWTWLRDAGELTTFICLLADYFQRTGRMERVRITADEPADVDLFTERLRFIRNAAPGFRYKVAINHYEFMERAEPEVIDWVPNLNNAFRDPELTKRIAGELREKGGRLCWYICCGPAIPNTFLRSPLVEARLLGWLTQRLDLDGFLRWAFCLWPARPYERTSWRSPFWPAGDMYFVLPGRDGAPVETLRYEALRAGIQDYELLRLLVERLGAERAAAVMDEAFSHILRAASLTSFVGADAAHPEALYSLDPADYHAARAVVLESLEHA